MTECSREASCIYCKYYCICCIFMRCHLHYSLQQGLGLPCWVIWTEVLILLHLLLQREELTLQLTAQTRQGVPDVVGQLLKSDSGSVII